jgi:hypothetical protein
MKASIIFGIMIVVAVPLLVVAFIHDEKKREAEAQEYLELVIEKAKKKQNTKEEKK